MSVNLLIERHLEFLSLRGGCTGSSESASVNMPHCWKSRVVAQIVDIFIYFQRELDTSQYKLSSDRKYAILPYDIHYVSTMYWFV